VTIPAPAIHAGAVVIGEDGVLLRGPSGAGKSSLALALIEKTASDQSFAALIGDDVIRLTARSGRVLAQGAPATFGLAERRGLGLVTIPALETCVIRLVVDLDASKDAPVRLPEPEASVAICDGVVLPRLALTHALSVDECARFILQALALVKTRGAISVDFP
jgi:serine kinase of HPr protein (carbohydrate metabolism regulator)